MKSGARPVGATLLGARKILIAAIVAYCEDPTLSADPLPEALRIFSALGYAVFRRTSEGVLRACHQLPDWGISLFGLDGEKLAQAHLVDRFPVLDNFLVDANAVWSSTRQQPPVRSGIWQASDEVGRDYELEATAIKVEAESFLIVQNVALGGDAHRVLLQSGRERMLELNREIQTFQQLQEELDRARRNAERLNQAKSEFLANMSHEVRTPLAGVLGLASLLLDTQLTAEQQGYVGSIIESARGLMRIVNDVLDFSRVESGKLQFEAAPFVLHDFMVSTVDRFRPIAEHAGLQLRMQLAASLPDTLVGDALRIRQVLDNLLHNAVKFTPSGEIVIQVDTAILDRAVAAIRFSVIDTGIGIDPARQRYIFESFAQADASTSRKYGGTGLGLSIVHRLVTKMGGFVGVSSRLGGGSTFCVTIPVVFPRGKGEEEPPESLGAPRSDHGDRSRSIPPLSDVPAVERRGEVPPGEELPRPESLHLLLAEDHEINRMLVNKMLTRRGFRVHGVSNGRSVLEALQTNDFDVILMDCQMPEMDGFAATRAIRLEEQQTGEYVPIIAITAHAMAGFREKCLAEGMDGYICKPFQPEELAKLVQAAARKRRRVGAARDTDHEL